MADHLIASGLRLTSTGHVPRRESLSPVSRLAFLPSNMQALLRSLPSQAQVLGNAVRVQLPQRAFSTLRPTWVQAAPRVPSFALCQRRFIHDSLFDDKLLNAVEISTEKNIVTKTPEERWAERSKRAMTYHAANPPPGPYHGKSVLLL